MESTEKTFAEQVRELRPGLAFVKTRINIERKEDLALSNIILEGDTPKDFGKPGVTVCPLFVGSYPRTLAAMTASQAGLWAVKKCLSEGWEISRANIESCLANLEMDM